MRRMPRSMIIAGLALCAASASAREGPERGIEVRAPLSAPPRGVAELRFTELFRMPIGPEGLELSERARELDGRRVRVVGYMVREAHAPRGHFLFAPLPVALDGDDEPLADDLPPTAIAVELPDATTDIPFRAGLLVFTGTLAVGVRADADDGRVEGIRLRLDAAASRALRAPASSKPPRHVAP